MILRSISRATGLRWKVLGFADEMRSIPSGEWALGVHIEVTDSLVGLCRDHEVTLIGLTRSVGHRESLNRAGLSGQDYLYIINSLPPISTVSYDLLTSRHKEQIEAELLRLRTISGLPDLEIEPWGLRDLRDPTWRK